MTSVTPPGSLQVHVECYAGARADETPRRFALGDQAIEVAEVVDRWLGPDHRYFKVKDSRDDTYILRHDLRSQVWELTVYARTTTGSGLRTHG